MAHRSHRNAASRPSIYQTVTDRIISSLKAGVIPWEKPWKTPRYAGGPFPRNFYTGKPYRGINVLLLWSSEYSSPFWLTFKQAQALKGTVRKGEHGTPIIFYKQLPEHAKKDEDATGEDERLPFLLCHYTVFNVEQCDGLTLPEISQPAIAPEIDEDELCESIITRWENRPALHLNSPTEYRAYYRSSTDSVHMPARNRFVDTAHYYSTLFHELIHSTGHESRLNRTFGDRFGDELYSKEELVAEMGAAFLSAIAGIANEHTDRNTTAYIQNWIEKLEEDNRLIVHAAANAQRAVDMILDSTFEDEKEATEEEARPLAVAHQRQSGGRTCGGGVMNSRFAYVSVSRASLNRADLYQSCGIARRSLSHDVIKASAIDLGKSQANPMQPSLAVQKLSISDGLGLSP